MADNSIKMREFGLSLLKGNKYGPDSHQGTTNPFQAYANYVSLISEKLKGAPNFTAMQAALKAMNPNPPRIYNPLAPLGPPPGGSGYMTDSLDAPSEGGSIKRDVIREAMNGTLVKVNKSAGGTLVKGPLLRFGGTGVGGVTVNGVEVEDFNNALNIYRKGADRTKNSMVEIDSPGTTGKRGMRIKEPIPGVSYDVPNFEALFDKKRAGPDFSFGQSGFEFNAPKPGAVFSKTRKQIEKERQLENDDVFFTRDDYEKGFIEGDDFDVLFMGDFVYVPFYFEDLRKPGRKIYFRAFLTRFSEAIAPDFNVEKTFGRVDSIPNYKSTTRTFSVGFKIVAMSPAGFSSMWKKVNNLSKLLYPMYRNSVMSAGPVCRIRIGDVLADGSGRGLPGFISSPLELNYSNAPWEVETFNGPISSFEGEVGQRTEVGKAPMMIDSSFSFTVIHERNPQIDEQYNFNQRYFRRIGTLDDDFLGDLAGDPGPSGEVGED